MQEITIRLSASGGLEIEIPSVLAEGRSHCVQVPLSIAGLSAIKTVLVQRQRTTVPSIGTRASPTASMIQKHLADKERQDRAAAKSFVKALRLEDITLDL